jgi:predicted 3-demethylubiquinone-9 3-methyltransferase (glyoxalase superfamily)
MVEKVTPFLMFQGKAEEAMAFYCETIPQSRVIDVTRHGSGEGEPGGMLARLSIGGQDVMIYDSPVPHAFTFTPAASLFVDCSSEEEQDRIVEALAEGGGFLMPIGNYGFSRRFAWLNDRYGVSWQVNLP